jgi:predicted nucleic acid-binding protein
VEIRFGALVRNWGHRRLPELEDKLSRVEMVHSGPELVIVHAQLRAGCRAIGHALHQQDHNADRWIAATAIRLGVPLVSNDGIFHKVPRLTLETLNED